MEVVTVYWDDVFKNSPHLSHNSITQYWLHSAWLHKAVNCAVMMRDIVTGSYKRLTMVSLDHNDQVCGPMRHSPCHQSDRGLMITRGHSLTRVTVTPVSRAPVTRHEAAWHLTSQDALWPAAVSVRRVQAISQSSNFPILSITEPINASHPRAGAGRETSGLIVILREDCICTKCEK